MFIIYIISYVFFGLYMYIIYIISYIIRYIIRYIYIYIYIYIYNIHIMYMYKQKYTCIVKTIISRVHCKVLCVAQM